MPPVVLRRTRVPLPLDAAGADAETTIALTVTLDLPRTLSPVAHGHGDPTIRIGAHEAWRAWRTTDGPATLRVRIGGGVIEARGWGPGAAAAVEAAGRLIGLADAPEAFVPANRLLADLVHRFPGLRLPASGSVIGALVPAILEQKVTGIEARRTWRALLREHGEPAPGPAGVAGMRIVPDDDVLARIPSFTWHRLGIERRRASLVRPRGTARRPPGGGAARARDSAPAGHPRHRAVDDRRGRPGGVGRSRRGQRGRLPSPLPRRLGARRRATGRRCADARAARTVRRAARSGTAAARGERHRHATSRAAHDPGDIRAI